MTLDSEDVEAIARRVAELVGSKPATRLVDVAELAAELGVSTTYVYRNAERLGAQRLGAGPKGRLRFDLVRARSSVSVLAESTQPPSSSAARKRAPGRRDAQRPTSSQAAAPAIKPRSQSRLGGVR